MTTEDIAENRAWLIGEAIENGMDEKDAIDRAALAVAAGTGAAGGFAAASVTSLGGVGVAASGTAFGVGAITAVAAPAVITAAAGYGIFKAISTSGRKDAVRDLLKYFEDTEQWHIRERILSTEGKGQLVDGRRPPAWGSASATLELLTKGPTSAKVGLFCSPKGHFVLTYDLATDHWAYVRFVDEYDFTGRGVGPTGHEFELHELKSMKALIQTLKNLGILKSGKN